MKTHFVYQETTNNRRTLYKVNAVNAIKNHTIDKAITQGGVVGTTQPQGWGLFSRGFGAVPSDQVDTARRDDLVATRGAAVRGPPVTFGSNNRLRRTVS